MKKLLQPLVLLLIALMVPVTATAAYEQLADGVYQDGSTLYITSGVTSLGDLQVNPSEIYCYATIPPACISNTFTGYDATLHVPAAGMVSYFTTLYWYNFNNILSDAIEPLSVTMNTTEAELEIGQQLSLSATVAPSDATPKTMYWASTDTSVATVSSSGKVTAVAVGECDILAACVDNVAVCHLMVISPFITIVLDKHELNLLPNHTSTLIATCSPFDVDLAVTSSNLGVAIPRIINGSIMVVGVAEGIATITVCAADGKCSPDSCEIIVFTDRGDVNCDGYVNISDVTKLIDLLLSDNSEGLSIDKADTNLDGNVNIADVTMLIDYLLSGSWPQEECLPELVTETYTINGVSFNMVFVEGGTFMMGNSSESDESPVHQVTLSDFSIGETEVTQALWMAVMETNPSYFTSDLQLPVERVSWSECQSFITKLNQMTGKTFRLPTEAEWEYAARGGKWTHGYRYAGSDTIDNVAWYHYTVSHNTHVVATKAPNELGLYDMSGNVSEWCQDKYAPYSSDAQVNPIGTSSSNNYVIRGGSWLEMGSSCRVTNRSYMYRAYRSYAVGLRLAL
jgi:formylglycine-generating enzyme required for sulfatase activity